MKRYKRDIKLRSGTLFHLMVEDDEGEWVRYEDHNNLKQIALEIVKDNDFSAQQRLNMLLIYLAPNEWKELLVEDGET